MPLKKTSFGELVRNSTRYLVQNTDITYLSQGSIAKALIEATNLEIARLQDFVSTSFDNGYLSSASGVYLDLFGEMLGLQRIRDRRAGAAIEDGAVRFYVDSGTLSSRLTSLVVNNVVIIPKGTTVSTQDRNIQFTVTEQVSVPLNARSIYVPISAYSSGAAYNVGANQLTTHNLGNQEVKVTNDIAITTGTDVEPDDEYRYRLSKAMTTRFGANSSAVQIVAASQPGINRVELRPYARGTGTFDVLLIPQGNRLNNSIKENTRRAIEQVTAFGVSPRVIEPVYVSFCITVQLRYTPETSDGQKIGIRAAAESAILRYLSSLSVGSEIVINQIRASILSSSPNIKDLKIIEICIDNSPRVISNIQLADDELVVPDNQSTDSIKVI